MREACLEQPHKYKFSRVVEPSQSDLDREETLREELKTVYVPKTNCYQMVMTFKDLPDTVKGLPLELEGAVQAQTNHHKSAYRQVKFDFYKEDGFGEAIEQV